MVLSNIMRVVIVAGLFLNATEKIALALESIQQPSFTKQIVYEDEVYPTGNAVNEGSDSLALVEPEKASPAPSLEKPSQVTQETDTFVQEYAVKNAPPKPWRIYQPSVLANHGIEIGGWIQQGITFNSLSPIDRFNGPNTSNDRSAEYQLNQAWLHFYKPTKTDGCGIDLGGKVVLIYGTDWRFGQSFGLENRFDDPNSFYGLVMPQFYGELAINDLTVKFGHFATNTSLELVPATANFFYSHALLMTGYFDPVLVTGVQADYKLDDNWKIIGGANEGWKMFEDPSDTWNFLGGVKWTSDDKRGNLSIMSDNGRQNGFTGQHDRNSLISVFTYKLNTKLYYGSQYTIGQEKNGSVAHRGQNANWYGTEQLFTLKLNDKWTSGLRYEWVRDEGGARVAGVGNVLLTDRGWDGLPGCAGSYQDVSLGLNYRPHPNFLFRPEVRWDFYNGDPNSSGQLPYDSHTRTSQFTTAMDMIFTY